MIVTKKAIKNSIKLFSIIVAITILVAQAYIIINESSFSNNNSKIPFDAITKAKYCEDKRLSKYTDALFKCFFAFISGCLLSEIKFLKTGII